MIFVKHDFTPSIVFIRNCFFGFNQVMNTNKTFWVVAFILLIFYPEFSQAQQSDEAALVTVIRNADRKSKMQKPKLYLNGKKKCIIPDAGYMTFAIKPGEHTVFAAFSKLGKSGEKIREASFSINAEPSQHYYMLLVIADAKRKIVSVSPIMESGAVRLMKDYSKCDCSEP